ncbi:MAG: type I-U CRISPR-associated RAMP protein Csb1/Cas7u [Acidimicrobiales bacterium]
MTRQDIHHIALRPEPSRRFQPTGFPDLGAAEYEQPTDDGGSIPMLLVESVQSMANHLEAEGWDEHEQRPVEALSGLPWVRVVDGDGSFLTSSRLEAHRVASAFIRNSKLGDEEFLAVLKRRFGLEKDRSVDRRQLATALLRLDPACLVHGVFFAEKKWPQQPKVTRALTAFIEAEDIRPVHSGGVKTDDVRHSVSDAATGGGTAEGYGMVPHHRVEYVAATIQLHVALDRGLLASYGLSEEAVELLEVFARWELASALESDLRLRTACSFRVEDGLPGPLSDASKLASRLGELAESCPELSELDDPVTEVVWNAKGQS